MSQPNQQPAHSPLPWHVSTNGATPESGGEPAFPGVHDSSGKPHGEDIVCECLGYSEQCKANAAFIVKACNSHQALVDALEHLEAAATKFTIGCNCQTAGEDAILYASLERAREALRSATQ